MMIDWTHFTPLESAIGGVVIGAAASMLILFCGRVAGISGILGGVLSRANNDKGWRIAFLLGMVLSPVLWRLVAPLPAVSITTSRRCWSWPVFLSGWEHVTVPAVPAATVCAACRVCRCVHWSPR